MDGDFSKVLLTTKTGDKVVGAKITGKDKGTIILLPQLQFDDEAFTEFDDETGNEYWSSEAMSIGRSLVTHLVEIDKALRSNKQITPTPNWALDSKYSLVQETRISASIIQISHKIEELVEKKSSLETELQVAGGLRRLLFEKGNELEEAILEALRLMEFSVERFIDSDSEFDSVFVSDEGRFIGEAEGKDRSAININKLSQLERNIQEDFARDEVTEYAMGVLFGNAYRLTEPEDRNDFFTEKCLTGAARSGVTLIRTPDLFLVAKYLKENTDDEFSKLCREAIKDAAGSVVVFPDVPIAEEIISDASEINVDNDDVEE